MPHAQEAKGKVERIVRDFRGSFSPYAQHWECLAESQQAIDAHAARLFMRRLSPATGLTVAESLKLERPRLTALPLLPEPFDIAVTRPVAVDSTVGFEQRRYSVPFQWVGQRVEIRGAAGRVQVLVDQRVIAVHPHHTPERILIDRAITTDLPPTTSKRRRRSDAWVASSPRSMRCRPSAVRSTSTLRSRR